MYRAAGPDVSGKQEEAEKGSKQAIVHPAKQSPVKEQQTARHHGQQRRIGQHPEYRQQAEHKQACHQPQTARPSKLRLFLKPDLNSLIPDTQEGCGRQHSQADQGQRKHGPKKLFRRQFVVGIKIEILRITHRGSHAPKVGGHGLEHHKGGQVFRPSDQPQHQNRKWNKGDERHLVGHHHGHKERQQH